MERCQLVIVPVFLFKVAESTPYLLTKETSCVIGKRGFSIGHQSVA